MAVGAVTAASFSVPCYQGSSPESPVSSPILPQNPASPEDWGNISPGKGTGNELARISELRVRNREIEDRFWSEIASDGSISGASEVAGAFAIEKEERSEPMRCQRCRRQIAEFGHEVGQIASAHAKPFIEPRDNSADAEASRQYRFKGSAETTCSIRDRADLDSIAACRVAVLDSFNSLLGSGLCLCRRLTTPARSDRPVAVIPGR